MKSNSPRNHFTPFLVVDNPGEKGSEHLHFDGEAKRRAEYIPGRFLVGFFVIVGFFALFGAVALAGQKVTELESRFEAEARR